MSFKGITVMTPEESLGNITAADDAAIFQSLIGSDGVLNIGSNFAATVISNNKVRVADGVLCVGGHMGRTAYGDYNDMTIENGVSGKKRNDIIYAKFLTSGSTDTFTLDVKKGTGTTGTATDPALTQGVLYENATLREFPLWRVKLEGLSIVAVEQMFTLVPTIPELEAKYNELNSNLTILKSHFYPLVGQYGLRFTTVHSLKFDNIFYAVANLDTIPNGYKLSQWTMAIGCINVGSTLTTISKITRYSDTQLLVQLKDNVNETLEITLQYTIVKK